MDRGNNMFDKNDINLILQSLYEYFSDSFFITNEKGNVIKASKNVADHCGIEMNYFTGKTVFELEKEKIFYPSVTAMVLKSHQREVTIQNTKTGKTHVSVGVPVFDAKGKLYRIISISRDITGQLDIAEQYSKALCAAKEQEYRLPFPFVCFSSKMQQVLNTANQAAETTSTLLLMGESGTGKDIIARAIHEMSRNKEGPFIKVNSVAIPENLFESELFGYNPGAFTGAMKEGKTGLLEAAKGGTFFLDEISELSLNQQAKLLQVLQDKKITRVGSTKTITIDLRFISATNKNIVEMVQQGKFREDLYYRLNVIPIIIPPLRERKEEVPLLIYYFLNKFNAEFSHETQISKTAIHHLMNYNWPGNVRELENLVERLIVTTKDPLIDVENLPEYIYESSAELGEAVSVNTITGLKETVREAEKKTIALALKKFGSANKAAKALNVDQSTLSRKIKKYNLLSEKRLQPNDNP